MPAQDINNEGFSFEDFDVSFLPADPYTGVDAKIIEQFPDEIVAIYKNGEGIIFNQESGKPVHGRTREELAAQIPAGTRWTYVHGPKSGSNRGGSRE